MKVAIVSQYFPPLNVGGVELATLALGDHLALRGHEVHIITSFGAGLPRCTCEGRLRIHRVRCSRLRYLKTALFWLGAFLCIGRVNPEVVHVQVLSAAVCGVLAKKCLGIPYLAHGQGQDVYGAWPLKKRITQLVVEEASVVVAVTEHMRSEMRRVSDREMEVIPNGVDMARFSCLPGRSDARSQLGLHLERTTLLYVGRLVPGKGVRVLVEAMDAVRLAVPQAELLIVGEGADLPVLQRLVNDLHLQGSTRFLGGVPSDKVPLFMSAADVFVLPSLSEGFPLVLAEAMAAGLPIVTTDVGGVAEIVIDGENGFLVKPGDARDLAESIVRLAGDSTLRQSFSARNRRRAMDYSWDGIAERVEGTYSGMVRSPL